MDKMQEFSEQIKQKNQQKLPKVRRLLVKKERHKREKQLRETEKHHLEMHQNLRRKMMQKKEMIKNLNQRKNN